MWRGLGAPATRGAPALTRCNAQVIAGCQKRFCRCFFDHAAPRSVCRAQRVAHGGRSAPPGLGTWWPRCCCRKQCAQGISRCVGAYACTEARNTSGIAKRRKSIRFSRNRFSLSPFTSIRTQIRVTCAECAISSSKECDTCGFGRNPYGHICGPHARQRACKRTNLSEAIVTTKLCGAGVCIISRRLDAAATSQTIGGAKAPCYSRGRPCRQSETTQREYAKTEK